MNKERSAIWILEDDEGCQFVYEQILKRDFDISYFSTLSSFKAELARAVKKLPILVIADLNLTDGNFIDFLSSSGRKDLPLDIPIIIVSADDDADSLRNCFRMGVNEYLTKPFRRNELLVKVETILRGKYYFAGKIKPTISIDGAAIEGLTVKESKLLQLFLNDQDRETNRDIILDEVWGGRHIHPKSVDVHLYNLRRKLSPYGQIIKSLGHGRWSLISNQVQD